MPGPTEIHLETEAEGEMKIERGKGSAIGLGEETETRPTVEMPGTGDVTTHETGTVAMMLLVTGTGDARIPGRETVAAAHLVTGTGVGTKEIGRGAGIVIHLTTRGTDLAKPVAIILEGMVQLLFELVFQH